MEPQNKLLELFEPPMSIGDLTRCVIAYLERYFAKQEIQVVYYCFKAMYSDSIYNTNNAPWGTDTNSSGRAVTAKGYPGWFGHIWVGLSKPRVRKGLSDSPARALKELGIHTISGGGGSTSDIPSFIKDKMHPERKLTEYCKPWSWDIQMFLDDFPSLKMLKLLKPDSAEFRLTFNRDKTVFSHYTNSPWDGESIPISRNKAAWLQEPEFYEPLTFESQPPAGKSDLVTMDNFVIIDDVLEN